MVILTSDDVIYGRVRDHLLRLRSHRHRAGTLFESGEARTAARLTVALGMTATSGIDAALVAERAVAEFAPAAMFFMAVGSSVSDDSAPGDVVVGTRVYACPDGVNGTQGLLLRPHSWASSHELEQLARHVASSGSWLNLLVSGREPRVQFKPVIASDFTADRPLIWSIHEFREDAVSIGSQGAGFAGAAHLNPSVPSLTIAAIRSHVDGDGKKEAAAFAIALARRIIDPPGLPDTRPVQHGESKKGKRSGSELTTVPPPSGSPLWLRR